jgi:carboxymethylenebutenolidase
VLLHGGRLGWQVVAAHPDRVAALAAFHPGLLVTDAPESPQRSAANLTAELYLGFAAQDPSMTAEQIAILERTLGEAGVRYRAEVYGGAQHDYAMADHVAYDQAARERHVGELRALLKRTLR